MSGIAILLIAAAIAYGIAHVLGVAAIPVLLVSGVVIAVTGLVPTDVLTDTLILGTILLLFVTGIELNPKRTRRQRRVAIQVGALQFTMLGTAGLLTALALGYAALPAIYLALALAASSTLIVVRLLQRRRQLFEPFGRLVLGVLLLQDLLVLLLVPIVTELQDGVLAVAIGVGATLALGAAAYAMLTWIAPTLERLDDEDEVMLLVLLAVLFAFIGLADLLGLPVVTGAFLAGVALSRYPLSGMARTLLGSISEFFSALFFISLGALIGIPTGEQLIHALVFSIVVLGLTPPLVTLVAERAGLSSRPAIESGLLLAQTSELSLVIGLFGLLANQIDAGVFTVIALVTLITMLATPFLTAERVAWWILRRRPTRLVPQRRKVDQLAAPENHVLILGSGATGMPLLETILGMGHDVVVIDDDPVVIQRLRDADITCLRGDASDLELLERAGAHRARIITSTIRRPRDNRRLLEFVKGVPVLVRVFEEADGDWIRQLGGTPILASHAAATEMLKWFDNEFRGRPAAGAARND